MAEIGNVGTERRERRRNRKVLLCKEEWRDKQRRTKNFLANKRLKIIIIINIIIIMFIKG
jgi:hypothetical protein